MDLLAGVYALPDGASTQEKDILLTLDATDVPRTVYPETLMILLLILNTGPGPVDFLA